MAGYKLSWVTAQFYRCPSWSIYHLELSTQNQGSVYWFHFKGWLYPYSQKKARESPSVDREVFKIIPDELGPYIHPLRDGWQCYSPLRERRNRSLVPTIASYLWIKMGFVKTCIQLYENMQTGKKCSGTFIRWGLLLGKRFKDHSLRDWLDYLPWRTKWLKISNINIFKWEESNGTTYFRYNPCYSAYHKNAERLTPVEFHY